MIRTRIARRLVTFHFSPQFGADKKTGRARLAGALSLARKEHPRQTHTSISHTRGMGVIALSSAPVGIDIELRTRPISARATHRLASLNERNMVATPLFLWVMKEAAWKSYRDHGQPSVISKIRIVNVRKAPGRESYLFDFTRISSPGGRIEGRGELLIQKRYILGIALLLPQLWSSSSR